MSGICSNAMALPPPRLCSRRTSSKAVWRSPRRVCSFAHVNVGLGLSMAKFVDGECDSPKLEPSQRRRLVVKEGEAAALATAKHKKKTEKRMLMEVGYDI